MSLTNALFSSVSGLETASTQISVIGDNIANASTPGFKEKRAEFSTVLNQSISAGQGFSRIGAGVLTDSISTLFTQGVFENTQRPTDLGISGRGFFVMEGTFGRSYTRSGMFGFDSQGFLIDSSNRRLQGYGIDEASGSSNGVLGDIQVRLPLSPPQMTTRIDLSMNLDSEETVPAITPFDPANPETTSNVREVVTIFDSLGTARQATIFFSKTAANQWDYNVALSAEDAGTDDIPGSPRFVVQTGGSGTLNFGADGTMQGFTGGAVNFDFDPDAGVVAAQPVSFSMGPYPGGPNEGVASTQVVGDTTTNAASQNGYASGTLSALDIDENGRLNGVFTNGVTSSLAQIALANFGNVEGLTEIGSSQVIESVNSGPPILAAANTGNVGTIRSSSLEKSNVDLAQQFVNLIVSQRAFQANTRTVSVANELMANLVSLGQ